jgi:hypothetical protein
MEKLQSKLNPYCPHCGKQNNRLIDYYQLQKPCDDELKACWICDECGGQYHTFHNYNGVLGDG